MMTVNNLQNNVAEKYPQSIGGAKIRAGCKVTIVDVGTGEILELKVVSTPHLEVQAGEVSLWSPMGKALWERTVGEMICVHAPKGTVYYRILEIVDAR
jgi:transcription elongation factor GreA